MAFAWMTQEGVPGNVLASFIGADGEPILPRPEFEIVRRPGVDNHGKYVKGFTCPEYSLLTYTDVADEVTALNLGAAMYGLTGITADLYWQYHFWSKVDILLAEPKSIEKNNGAIGGNVNGDWVVPVQWHLIGLA